MLRPYQESAIESWFAQGCHSIWAMATGTGKTKSAINAVERLFAALQKNKHTSLLVVVICPYLTLVDQWEAEFLTLGWLPIKASDTVDSWRDSVKRGLSSLALTPGSKTLIITTQATFCGSAFQEAIRGFPENTCIVADEVHNLGSRKAIESLPASVKYRLGLSATPQRHHDSEGTEAILDYFGKVSFTYSLRDAIRDGWLAKYKYYPRVVDMTVEETESYVDLTMRFAKILAGREFFELTFEEAQKAGALLRARSSLLGSISAKWIPFWRDIAENKSASSQLIYCAEGTSLLTPGFKQIQVVAEGLTERKLNSHATYDSTTPRETRARFLSKFQEGELTYLLSMRCLDEGVDLPNANLAYFLASSANPRQFIQRRGRVLRLHAEKDFAVIYDYFALPSKQILDEHVAIADTIGRRELERALEFVGDCENRVEALSLIGELGAIYGH